MNFGKYYQFLPLYKLVLRRPNLTLYNLTTKLNKKNIDIRVEESADIRSYMINSDKNILFKENQGFSKGFNSGISISEGEFIMMCNNDTEFPENWDLQLLENFNKYNNVGLVSPTYTSGSRLIALRNKTKNNQIILKKFGDYPSGVAYCVNRNFAINKIKGWCEDYPIASGEDADFCYRVWSKNKEIIIDERVLILHEGKVTTKSKIKNWKKLWKKNAKLFRKKWFFYYFFSPIARIYLKIKNDK